MESEVGVGIGMGNKCISMADSCQCMTKTTTVKKKKERKGKKIKTTNKDMVSFSFIPKFTRSGSLNSESILFLYFLNSLKYFLHIFLRNKHFILLLCITYHLSVEAPEVKIVL